MKTGVTLRPGEEFVAVEHALQRVGDDRHPIVFARLADGRGWAFTSVPRHPGKLLMAQIGGPDAWQGSSPHTV